LLHKQWDNKMKLTGIFALFAMLTLSIGNVMAVPSGKTLEFASPRGKVTFDGKVHADKGLKCADCHSKPKLFEMKKGGDKISMAAMNEGKFCGTCHNGKKAFSVKSPAIARNERRTCREGRPEEGIAREYVGDAVITTKVKAAVLENLHQVSQINVETFKGTVQLSGFVSRAQYRQGRRSRQGHQGVQAVKNDMIVK
jgi:c(7)-type cytochrome triheme protein